MDNLRGDINTVLRLTAQLLFGSVKPSDTIEHSVVSDAGLACSHSKI